ncbi:MAG: prepilin-type N-terminal cleavage/methylation domain-containing protein [Hyphomicrobiaceae bacterium]|nr:MAG: prepilin-type N-terminal cleavage/methylation domain-containing protein [Hyphomicrobiaceae bacterium]
MLTRVRSQAGVTLLELLVVLGILALIAGIIAPQVLGYFGKAKTEAAKLQINALQNALDLYFLENGSYPRQEVGLEAS